MEATLKQLREKVDAAKALIEIKKQDQVTNRTQLTELSNTVTELDEKFSRVWKLYEEKREEYLTRSSAPAESAWTGADTEGLFIIGAPRWRCVRAHTARSDVELSLQPGDLASDAPNLEPVVQPDWIWLAAHGRCGWFPESHVEAINAPASAEVSGPVEEAKTELDKDLGGVESSVATKDVPTKSGRRWRCVRAFKSRYYVELSLQLGDVVCEAPTPPGFKKPSGWVWLTARGRTGWVPDSYVEVIDASTANKEVTDPTEVLEAEPNSNLEDTKKSAATEDEPTASAPRWRCVRAHTARDNVELSLQVGDLASDASTHLVTAPGWIWLAAGDQCGWFPASHVKEINAPASAEVSNPVGAATNSADDFYITAYPYKAQDPRDISFEAGERIEVIRRDGDWWTGRIGNRVGIFSSNYVVKDASSIPVEYRSKAHRTSRSARRAHRQNRLAARTDRAAPEEQSHESKLNRV